MPSRRRLLRTAQTAAAAALEKLFFGGRPRRQTKNRAAGASTGAEAWSRFTLPCCRRAAGHRWRPKEEEAPLPTLTKTDMADEATTMKMHSKVRWGNTDEVEGLLKIKGTADCQVRSERATRALVLNRVTHKRRGIAQPTVEPIPALTVVRPPAPRCAHRIKPRATTRST